MTLNRLFSSSVLERWLRQGVAMVFGLWCMVGVFANSGIAATLTLEITPQFNAETIQLGSLRYQNWVGEQFSITRVSYLLSGFALERSDGSWLELSNHVAWMDMERGRRSIQIADATPAAYRSFRFHVGLNPELNHANVAQFAANDPLNPNLNQLHWSWQGGYIFMALEGMWRSGAGPYDGWSYHFARDTNFTRINVPVSLDLSRDTKLELSFDVATLLNVPRPVSFAKDGSSTHSRDGDPVAAALAANLPGSFRVRQVIALSPEQMAKNAQKPLYLPAKFTPYLFQMSATFPIPDLPRDNPLTKERVSLGEKLFHETALSRGETHSCASCHQESAAFSDTRPLSLGVRDQEGARNAMPLFNLAWKSSFFWDGRAPSLRAQALFPIQDHVEMDESLSNIVAKLSATKAKEVVPSAIPRSNRKNATVGDLLAFEPLPDISSEGNHTKFKPLATDYPGLFEAAFGSREITSEKLGLALEDFVLTIISSDSKFDRAMKGDVQLTEQEKRGFELFMTENDPRRKQFGADCFHCHGGALFQGQGFVNNGLDNVFTKDPGRSKFTGKDSDIGKFSIPSLRNVELTAPYMHDGRFKTLEEVVEHYSTGTKRSPTLDPNLAKHADGGLHLSVADKKALVAFLKTLTDERFLAKARESAKAQ